VNVAICEYGAGNVRSVRAAFGRLGVSETRDVFGADLAVVPGVGSARSAVEELNARGHADALRARFACERPILGICLGLQVALDETEEDGGVAGLGLLAGRAVRLRDGRVPRIGWARVDGGDAFYFAHSYAAVTPCASAWSEDVVAEVRHGSFVGCQFHPERSGAAGAAYLEGIVSSCRSLG